MEKVSSLKMLVILIGLSKVEKCTINHQLLMEKIHGFDKIALTLI